MKQFLSHVLDVFANLAIGFSVVAAFRGRWDVATYLLVLGLHFGRQSSLMARYGS